MIDDGTAQSFFNYITVCLTAPDLYNKYFRHAYKSFLYSSLRVRFVYMQFLIYFQEGWKFGPCGSSSWVISLILHISCVFFFGGAGFPCHLCLLVPLWFELTVLQWSWVQAQLRGADLCSLPLQRTAAPHFRPKFIPVPHRSGLCPVPVALPADVFVVGGQRWRAGAALCV